MAEIILQDIRIGTDVHMLVTLTDSGVAISWDSVDIQQLFAYSEPQRAFAGNCTYVIDEEDATKLHVTYPAAVQKLLGRMRLVAQVNLLGNVATYDAFAFNIVKFSDDDEDPTVEEIEVPLAVEAVDTTIMYEILRACQAATAAANEAKEGADEAADAATAAAAAANSAAESANTAAAAATTAKEGADTAAAAATAAAASASSAAGQATTAAGAAMAAKAAADAAASGANTAAASATSAAAAATTAKEGADTAAAAATAAAASATSAAGSATAAADNANTKAGLANTAAETANAAAAAATEATAEIPATIAAAIAEALGAGHLYAGVATPSTNPGTPAADVFYIASTPGTYTNFGGLVVNDGEVCALVYDGTWSKQVTGAATAKQVAKLAEEISSVQICEDNTGSVATNVECELKQGRTYRFYNDSPSNTYFALYTRITQDGANEETITTALPYHKSVDFTPSNNYHYLRFSITYAQLSAKVVVTDLGSLDSRIGALESRTTNIENTIPTIQSEINTTNENVKNATIGLEIINVSSVNGSIELPEALSVNKHYYLKFVLSFAATFQITLRSASGSSGAVVQTISASKQWLAGTNEIEFDCTANNAKFLRLGEADSWSRITSVVLAGTLRESVKGLNVKVQNEQTQITSIQSQVNNVDGKPNDLARIVSDVKICETSGSAVANVACKMIANHTYKITNISDSVNYFAVYARQTATSENILISSSLSWKASVDFTPDVTCEYIRLSAGYQGTPCKVRVEDVASHEYRIETLEGWKPGVDAEIQEIKDQLSPTKHIFLDNITYPIRECTGWNRGAVEPFAYAEQLYDALMAQYPTYITKVDCLTDSGITVPGYYTGDIVIGSTPLMLSLPLYHFRPINYSANSLVKVFLIGGLHGEAVGVNSLYWFCKHLCDGDSNEMQKLRNGIDLFVIPYANPSTTYIMQRSTPEHPVTSIGRLNWNLVNLNRNFPIAGWEATHQWNEDGTPYMDWSGATAGSEYETQVIMHYANIIQPDIFIDCHNSPYIVDGTTDMACMVWVLYNAKSSMLRTNQMVVFDIAPMMSYAIQKGNQQNLPQTFGKKYVYLESEPTNRATTINWAAQEFNSVAFTCEGVQSWPYINQEVVLPVGDRVLDASIPYFTECQELAIESLIKRAIQQTCK